MNTAQNGKGHAPRPVDGERFRSGWDAIFSKNDLWKSHESFDGTLSYERTEQSKCCTKILQVTGRTPPTP